MQIAAHLVVFLLSCLLHLWQQTAHAQHTFTVPRAPWLQRIDSPYVYQFNTFTGALDYSWYTAREHCLSQGADLVWISDTHELAWIVDHYPIQPRTPGARDDYVLIGLTEGANEGNWTWVDEKKTQLDTTWLRWIVGLPIQGDPNMRCAALTVKERVLMDINCDLPVTPALRTRFACKAQRAKFLAQSLELAAHCK